ncbi:MAG: DUF3592 domain-containing protein [Hyphomicrobiales bacterium]
MKNTQDKAKPPWVGHLVFFSMMASFFIGTIYGGITLYDDWSSRWQLADRGLETRAIIVNSFKASRGFKMRLAACNVTYEYQVSGITYRGNDDVDERRCLGYTPGISTLPLRYLPEKPGRAWIRDNEQRLFNDIINAIAFLMGIGFCFVFVYAIIKDREYAKSSDAV